jgi:SET family sugar efflux transporter-like MFS transporter
MIITSIATSATTPLIALYLVRDLGVGLSTAGLFFTSLALPGLALGVLIGRRSDRWRSRIPALRGAAVWVGVGWGTLALSPSAGLSLAAGAVFLSAGGVLMGQAYAALHDVMTRDGETQPGLINTTVRTGWSFGFVFGPLLGSTVASLEGFRATFAAAACLYLFCLLPLHGLRISVPTPVAAPAAREKQGRPNFALLTFVGLCALVLSSQTIRNTYLPIHVTAQLKGSVQTYGTIVAVSPVLELITIPLAGLLSQRMAIGWLIAGGIALGAVEYAALASSTMLWQVYGTQAMDAWLVAVVLGLGVTYAQQLSPRRPGAASSLFFAAFSISSILGGLLGSAGVPVLGVPHIFLIPSGLCALAAVVCLGIELAAVRGGRRSPSAQTAS